MPLLRGVLRSVGTGASSPPTPTPAEELVRADGTTPRVRADGSSPRVRGD